MRCIEKTLDIERLSNEGRAERYSAAKTPHTVFNWWARRPFAAMRGVVAGALLDVDEDELGGLQGRRLLDLFSGGATIPLVAAQAGAEVHAVENNELAVFVNAALLRMSQTGTEIPRFIREHGARLLQRFALETEEFFPARRHPTQAPIAYFWSRGVGCPNCDALLSLLKRPILAQRSVGGGKKFVYLRREPMEGDPVYGSALCSDPAGPVGGCAWQGRNAIKCPFCGSMSSASALRQALRKATFDEPTAVCSLSASGKQYRLALRTDCPSDMQLERWIRHDLAKLGSELPDVELPEWSGVTNPALYGLARISDLFNLRQRAVLVRLCRLLHEEATECIQRHGRVTGVAIAAFLSGLVDQLVDWNSRLSMWIPQNEQVGRALSGPGIPMLWDFVEIDPLGKGPANLWDKLDRIVTGVSATGTFAITPEVVRADARSLPFRDGYFDAVVTDPPYFDNLFYSVLADCVYVWKRLALKDLLPGYFEAPSTNASRELTAAKYRHGSVSGAAVYFRAGIRNALCESARVLKDDGVVAVVFAHSTIEAWASLLDGLREANLLVTAVWPLEVERQHRPRGMTAAAVNTSFVLIARHAQVGERRALPVAAWRSAVRGDASTRGEPGKLGELGAAVRFAKALQLIGSRRVFDDPENEMATPELLLAVSDEIYLTDSRLALGERPVFSLTDTDDENAQLALL